MTAEQRKAKQALVSAVKEYTRKVIEAKTLELAIEAAVYTAPVEQAVFEARDVLMSTEDREP